MMKSCRLLAAFSLALVVPLTGGLPSQVSAQRRPPVVSYSVLDHATCRWFSTDTRNVRVAPFEREQGEVIVDRQIYEYNFFIRALGGGNTNLVCEIDFNNFDTLSLQMAVEDSAVSRNEEITVNIYQSGSVISTYEDVQPGDILTTTVDLQDPEYANSGDIAIELLCHQSSSYYGCHLAFLNAELAPTNAYLLESPTTQAPSSAGENNNGGSSSNSILDSLVDTAVEELNEGFGNVLEGLF